MSSSLSGLGTSAGGGSVFKFKGDKRVSGDVVAMLRGYQVSVCIGGCTFSWQQSSFRMCFLFNGFTNGFAIVCFHQVFAVWCPSNGGNNGRGAANTEHIFLRLPVHLPTTPCRQLCRWRKVSLEGTMWHQRTICKSFTQISTTRGKTQVIRRTDL